MSKHVKKSFILNGFLLFLLTFFAPAKSESYDYIGIRRTRFSVWPGADITFEPFLEDYNADFGAWYRDLMTPNLQHVDTNTPYCYQNLQNLSTLQLIDLTNAKYRFTWNAVDGSGAFTIQNVTLQDDGVYCFAAMKNKTDLLNSVWVAAYLKVTLDEHTAYPTMVIILSCTAGWLLIISLGLALFHIQLYLQRKKLDEKFIKNQKQREIDSKLRVLHMLPGTINRQRSNYQSTATLTMSVRYFAPNGAMPISASFANMLSSPSTPSIPSMQASIRESQQEESGRNSVVEEKTEEGRVTFF